MWYSTSNLGWTFSPPFRSFSDTYHVTWFMCTLSKLNYSIYSVYGKTQRKSWNEGSVWCQDSRWRFFCDGCWRQENVTNRFGHQHLQIVTLNKSSTLRCRRCHCISWYGIMINLEIVPLRDSMFMSQWQKLVRTHPKYTNSNNTPSNVYDINHFYNWI